MLYLDKMSFATASPTTADLDNDRVLIIGPTGGFSVDIATPTNHPNPSHEGISPHKYLIGAFVPTILAVLFTIPWHILALAFKELEPFHQMQKPQGASAADSIALDYKGSVSAISTVQALFRGHFLVWWSGLLAIVTLVLAPLASETVFIGFTGHCTATSNRSNCSPRLSVYPVAARLVQGVLVVVALVTVGLAIATCRRKSGLYANPYSIAGIASLFQDDSLIEKVRQLHPYPSKPAALKSFLQASHYRIGTYQSLDGGTTYGLTVCPNDSEVRRTDHTACSRDGKKYTAVTVTAVDEHSISVRPKPRRTSITLLTHPISLIIFCLTAVGLEILIIYYYHTGGNTAFERFMDSDGFGVGFLFTAVGVVLKMYWTLLDDGKFILARC